MATEDAATVFRIPLDWYQRHPRTENEILLRLGFVRVPGGGWACSDETAKRVAFTICAYSFDLPPEDL